MTPPPAALASVDSNGSASSGGPLSADGATRAAASAAAAELARSWSAGSASASSSAALLGAEMAAAREQLHDRLLPVVLGLSRCGRLEVALRQFAVNRQVRGGRCGA